VHSLDLIGLGLLATLVPAGFVTALKGRYTVLLAGLCLLFPLLWYSAFALAAPTSWWARRFYGADKLERATVYHERWARRFAE